MRRISGAVWLILVSVGVLISIGSFTGRPAAEYEPKYCGDTSGPGGTDVPCQCGDIVATSTRLNATDPVLSTVCPNTGLYIYGVGGFNPPDSLVLEINGTLRGSGRGFGIVVMASRFVTVTRGRITGFETGMWGEENNDVTFSRLEVFDNTGIGVDLDENWGNTIIERSTVRGNGSTGIQLDNGASAIRNRVADNAGWGISAASSEGAGELTVGNVVVRNGRGGIYVSCLRCRVEKNLVLHNRSVGIKDASGDDPRAGLGDNTFTGNICSGNSLVGSNPPGLCR